VGTICLQMKPQARRYLLYFLKKSQTGKVITHPLWASFDLDLMFFHGSITERTQMWPHTINYKNAHRKDAVENDTNKSG